MSTEAMLLSALVEGGASALRSIYGKGVTANHFAVYEDEFKWVESRLARKKPVNRRIFREKFPDFEWMRTKDEDIGELALELKEECALAEVNGLISMLAEQMEKDNVLELAVSARERLAQITRAHSPLSDIDLDEWQHTIRQMRQGQILAKQGQTLGIQTGINFLDYHWGGIMPGQFIEILGRTGEGKSYFTTIIAWMARKAGNKIGIFTPELSEHEVKCRYHTIASADKDIQEAIGIKHSFRNRALMHRHGFNLKSYQRLCEYLDELPGRIRLLSGSGMAEKMSVGYIEDKIVEYELDLAIVDPIYMLKPVRFSSEDNTYQETMWVAESLHMVTEHLGVPIIFTNQAHLDGNRGDAPGKEKSFGAKGLLHLSDYVLGVMHISEEHRMICKSSKSRFGESGFRFDMDLVANTGHWKVTTPLSGSYFNGNPSEDLKREYVANAKGKGKGK